MDNNLFYKILCFMYVLMTYMFWTKAHGNYHNRLECYDCAKYGCQDMITRHPKWTGRCEVQRGNGKCFIRKDPNDRLYWGCIDDIFWPDVPWRRFNGCTEDWNHSWKYNGRRKPIIWCVCDSYLCNDSIERINGTIIPYTTSKPTTPDGKEGEDDLCMENGFKLCDQQCNIIKGRAQCSCNQGYLLQPDGKTCRDFNECLVHNGGCAQTCINVPGSYRCSCHSGYTLAKDGKNCIDHNECGYSNGGCSHTCQNIAGSFRCSCPPGYTLMMDMKTCQDVNECLQNNGGCSHLCTNVQGTFQCSCPAGYELSLDGRQCEDINECKRNMHNCVGQCVNNVGSYTCACGPGFQLSTDGNSCVDIDECLLGQHSCVHSCINTVGSYICECQPGYTLSFDSKTCVDIDECTKSANAGCEQICTNTQGSYYCECRDGYTLDANQINCMDIDECAFGMQQCSQGCVNTPGSYECVCFDGYELSTDGRTCVDINECLVNNGGCSDICNNNIGSFSCQCTDENLYTLAPDGRNCIANCPTDFILDYSTRSCYKIVTPSLQDKYLAKDYAEAERECQALHSLAHLVTIETAAEKDFLASYLRQNPFMLDGWQGWWTSAKFDSSFGEFVWTPETQLIDQNNPLWSFKKEPYADTCLWVMQVSSYDYTWGNYECVTKSGYICEINLP